MQIIVNREVSDAQLIEMLKDQRFLPKYLKEVIKINPVMADDVTPVLARAIVSKARKCNESHLVSDVTRVMFNRSPSPEEMASFQEAVDEVVIRGEPKARNHLIKNKVGQLWYSIRKAVGTEEKEEEATNAVVGIRG